jgi:ankyrin repeat domain-containing protein 17
VTTGLHSQSGSDAELLRRLTSSLCSSVSALPRHSSESSDVPAENVSAESLLSKPEDLLAVRQLLDGGRNPHETTDEGESLLSLACSAGYLELAQVS